MVVDFSITILLKEKLKIHRYIAIQPALFSLPALIICLTGFGLFESNNPKILVEYSTFFIISVIGLIINNLVIYLLEKKLKFYFAKFVAIMVTSVWNFLANYYLNFTH